MFLVMAWLSFFFKEEGGGTITSVYELTKFLGEHIKYLFSHINEHIILQRSPDLGSVFFFFKPIS